jgi:hypothetical protein
MGKQRDYIIKPIVYYGEKPWNLMPLENPM